MSTIHNAIKYGSIIRAFPRFVGLADEEEGTVRLGETLQPVLDAWAIPEMAFLRGEGLFSVARVVAPVALEFGYAVVINPAGSNLLVVVEKVTIDHGVATGEQFLLGLLSQATAEATLANAAPANRLDSRGVVSSRASTRTGTDASSGLATSNEVRRNNVPGSVDMAMLPMIVAPGFSVAVNCSTVNTGFTANLKFREHLLQHGEIGT